MAASSSGVAGMCSILLGGPSLGMSWGTVVVLGEVGVLLLLPRLGVLLWCSFPALLTLLMLP